MSFVSVCLRAISLHGQSIAPQTILRNQRQIKVEKYVGFSLKLLRSGVTASKPSERANMQISTGLPRDAPSLRNLEAPEVSMRECIDFLMLYSSVASPLPTLIILVGDHGYVKWPSPSVSSTTQARTSTCAFRAWRNLFAHAQDILISYIPSLMLS